MVFIKSAKSNSKIPVNAEAAIWVRPAERVEGDRVTIVVLNDNDEGEVVSGELVGENENHDGCKRGRRSHFATCPYAKSFRRRST